MMYLFVVYLMDVILFFLRIFSLNNWMLLCFWWNSDCWLKGLILFVDIKGGNVDEFLFFLMIFIEVMIEGRERIFLFGINWNDVYFVLLYKFLRYFLYMGYFVFKWKKYFMIGFGIFLLIIERKLLRFDCVRYLVCLYFFM